MSSAEPVGRDLRDYLSVLRRRKMTIVFTVLVVVGAALVASLLQSKVYEGRARVLLKPSKSLFQPTAAVRVDPNEVETEVQTMHSDPVKSLARETLGVIPEVTITPVGSTPVVDIRARDKSPERAAQLANGYAEAYVEFRHSRAAEELEGPRQELQAQIDSIQGRIDAVEGQLANVTCPPASAGPCSRRDSLQRNRDSLVAQQAPLRQKLDQYQVDTAVARAGAEIITPAAVPNDPVQPRPVRNALMGIGVGLLAGVALALLRDHFDDSLKSKEDLERMVPGLPVLGLIPALGSWRNKSDTPLASKVEPNSPTAEAYRALRTSIQFSAVDRMVRAVTITSPSAAEGKTTTTANLAVALARAGQRVVVMSCDLRRPRIHEFFQLPNTVGFTSMLLGEASLSEALQDVPGEEGLRLLGSGPLPHNPSELLGSKRADDVLRALRDECDIVLLDCPPVLPVTDAAVLSSKTDATLLVVTAGTTTGKQAARAVELLHQVGASLMGMVLNGVKPGSGYDASYYYYRRDDNGSESRRRRREPISPRQADV